ncbi:nucleotidyltransferase family protein [Arthrobacter sp. UYEF21]|uniref:nucleotidyltransferase family protein n=1 Tax=Arthrobacter sp. UYEF21 TaxID=1756364 RepID=UPI00339A3CDE
MANPGDETQLSIPEGVLLGHALVSRVADSLGIRAFFIKGPASVLQGLRLPKTSGDVDVFVHPEELELMLQGLRARGWRERPTGHGTQSHPKHSVTLDHPGWPCCIDVHFRFPGMENAAGDCFEVMWANTEVIKLAGQKVRAPSKALGIVILALHALRAAHLPAYRQELLFLTEVTERQSHTAAILDMSTALGSLAAIRPFLQGILPATASVDWPPASMEWLSRVMAKEPGTVRLIAFALAPLREKPVILFRGVFPGREVYPGRNIVRLDWPPQGRLRLHMIRWARFLRVAPQVARDLRQLRKNAYAWTGD